MRRKQEREAGKERSMYTGMRLIGQYAQVTNFLFPTTRDFGSVWTGLGNAFQFAMGQAISSI